LRFHAKPGRHFLSLPLWIGIWLTLALVVAQAQNSPDNSSTSGYQTGKIVSVRQIARNGALVSRYSSTHVFTMDFTVRVAGHSYCVDYETIVLDEVNDLRASDQKDVQVDMQGKHMIVILPSGRRIKAQTADATQC
jgi:hypothetical protein